MSRELLDLLKIKLKESKRIVQYIIMDSFLFYYNMYMTYVHVASVCFPWLGFKTAAATAMQNVRGSKSDVLV